MTPVTEDKLPAQKGKEIRTPESRRPGFVKLCLMIRKAHPTWSKMRVAAEAKARYIQVK